LGGFLLREGIGSSMIATMYKNVELADLAPLTPKQRGRKPDGSARQIQQLGRDNTRLRHELEHAELVTDSSKKTVCCIGAADLG
jgi:hypothetical protein